MDRATFALKTEHVNNFVILTVTSSLVPRQNLLVSALETATASFFTHQIPTVSPKQQFKGWISLLEKTS